MPTPSLLILHFFPQTRRRAAHEYIKKKERGKTWVIQLGVCIMPIHKDTCSLLQIKVARVRPDQLRKKPNPPEVPGRGGVTLLEPRLRTTGVAPP